MTAPIEDINPLIPAGYDIAWTVVVVVLFVAVVVAVVLGLCFLAKRR